MVASNELNQDFFVDTAKLAFEIKEKTGVRIEFTDLGVGIGIPYKLELKKADYNEIAKKIRCLYDKIIVPYRLDPLGIYWGCAHPTGPYGLLITTVIHKKHIYREYIGVDSCMADFMRPGM